MDPSTAAQLAIGAVTRRWPPRSDDDETEEQINA
jgi:hypothetical protein